MKICKYPLHAGGDNFVRMPRGAHLLCVQQQGVDPCLWAEVDFDNEMATRVVTAYCTGQESDTLLEETYISTVQLGWFVVHFYDKGEQP